MDESERFPSHHSAQVYLKYFLSNESHIDILYVIFKTFLVSFPGFTGNDIKIQEKLDLFAGTST